MTTDMTKGTPVKLLASFMISILLGNLQQQLYGIADTFMVGDFPGVNALAAVGASSGVTTLTIGTIQGLQ